MIEPFLSITAANIFHYHPGSSWPQIDVINFSNNSAAKTILNESESFLADAAAVIQNANESLLTNGDVDYCDVLPDQAIIDNKVVP